jgi:hypothetical protein
MSVLKIQIQIYHQLVRRIAAGVLNYCDERLFSMENVVQTHKVMQYDNTCHSQNLLILPQQGGARSGFGGGEQFVLGAQLFRRLAPGRIKWNATYRAHLLALGLVEMADALGALVRIDLVDLGAHVNGVIWALGLANVAVDAFVGNQ